MNPEETEISRGNEKDPEDCCCYSIEVAFEVYPPFCVLEAAGLLQGILQQYNLQLTSS